MPRKRQARKCHAHCTDGRPCPNWAMNGTTVCSTHGGRAPQVKAAAARNDREAQARAAVEKFGLPVKTTPEAALRDELERTAGLIAYYLAKAQGLDEADLIWGTAQRVIKTGQPGQQGVQGGQPSMEVTQGAKPHVYLQLLERERKHYAAVAAEMVRQGIEKRLVTVTEMQVAQLKRVMDAIFGDLELTPEQRVKLSVVVPARLRELGAA